MPLTKQMCECARSRSIACWRDPDVRDRLNQTEAVGAVAPQRLRTLRDRDMRTAIAADQDPSSLRRILENVEVAIDPHLASLWTTTSRMPARKIIEPVFGKPGTRERG